MIDYRLPLDEPIFRALNGSAIPWLDGVMVLASSLPFGITCATVTVLWMFAGIGKRAVQPVLHAALSLTVVDYVGSHVLKVWFDRLRPCYAMVQGTFRQLVPVSHSGSMPSLHAADAISVAVAMTLVWPSIGKYLIPVALLIGVSRIFVGVHWPSDVAAGLLYGSSVAMVVHLAGTFVVSRLTRKPVTVPVE